jgi:hypothetical protein
LAGQVTNNTISRTTFSGTVAPGAWTHIAYVRSSNVIRVYVNGVVSATTLSNSAATGRIRQVGEGRTSGLPFPGYISNFRLVGSAVYTSNFTPPTSPVTAITNTQLLCDFTNAGIIDNAEMNNLETVGNAQISTAQSKFGGASMAFDGTGDYLTIPFSQNFAFGSGDFTIEFWVYFNTVSARQTIVSLTNSAGNNSPWYIELNSSYKLRFLIQTSGGQIFVDSGPTPTVSTWTHVACVRSGSTAYLFVNGVSQGTMSPSTNALVSQTTPVYVGVQADLSSFPLNAYIDDFRITKGYARYTANFTPQRSQWQDQ